MYGAVSQPESLVHDYTRGVSVDFCMTGSLSVETLDDGVRGAYESSVTE